MLGLTEKESIIFLLSFITGMLWGLYVLKIFYKHQFKKIIDELHNQYLFLLDQHGIKIKNEFKPNRTESM